METFESYNAIIWGKSVHSNHLAPSWGITLAFAHYSWVQHLFSGGPHIIWENEQSWKYLQSLGLVYSNFGKASSKHAGTAGIWWPLFPQQCHTYKCYSINTHWLLAMWDHLSTWTHIMVSPSMPFLNDQMYWQLWRHLCSQQTSSTSVWPYRHGLPLPYISTFAFDFAVTFIITFDLFYSHIHDIVEWQCLLHWWLGVIFSLSR